MMPTTQPTTWIEVNTTALRHNLRQTTELVGPGVRVMAVVKADAYGHGASGAARAFLEAGAKYLGVTTLEEGLELRSSGISAPILVFCPVLPEQVETALLNDLNLTLFDLPTALHVSQTAEKTGKRALVHVKVDTGMGRLGIMPDDCPHFMYETLKLQGIEVAGVYTHFADSSGRNLASAREQNRKFGELIKLLHSKDIPTGLCHAANSGAILNMPESHYDMVRPGTILYGQYPSRNIQCKIDLHDTWTLKTRVVAIRKLQVGSTIGYGSEFTTARNSVIAILAIGYADGFTVMPESAARRAFSAAKLIANLAFRRSSAPQVTLRGKRAPVVGRVSMQMCSVDVTDIPGVEVGDEVIVPARRVTISSRIPRVYAG
jgi:alanine racemase